MKLHPKIQHITFTTPPSKDVVKMINKMVTIAAQLRFCPVCLQMTNHDLGTCLKCKTKNY